MSCCGPDDEDIEAIVRAIVLEASALRVKAAAGPTYVLSDDDFPSLTDLRAVMLVTSGVTDFEVPDTLTQPVGAFVLIVQGDADVPTYVGTGTATVIPANGGTEDKGGGDDTEQVLQQSSAGIWRLAGRTAA